jgi:Mitochondrial import 2
MTSTQASSYIIPSDPVDEEEDDVASLPSDTETDSTMSGPVISDAEREWRESLQQLELLLTMVLVPYMGKYFGRKAAYWGELKCCFCGLETIKY